MTLRFVAVFLLGVSLQAAPSVAPEFPLSLPDSIPALGSQSAPALASRGEDAFAVWTDTRDNRYGMVVGSRVADDGTFLDPHGILIDADGGWDPQIVWTGSEYLVLSGSRRGSSSAFVDTYAHRVKPDGTLIGDRVHLGALSSVHLYSNGREAVMTAYRPDGPFLAYLDEGQIRDTLTNLPYFSGSAIVPDGDDWIFFRSGSSCDPTCGGPWVKQTRIRGRKIVSDRNLDLALLTSPFWMTAASNGDGLFVVAWHDISRVTSNNVTKYEGMFRYLVVDRDGKVIDLPRVFDRVKTEFSPTLAQQGAGLGAPAVTWFGGRFVATWSWFDGERSDVRAIGIRPDGTTDQRDPVLVHSTSSPVTAGTKRAVVAATSSRLHFLWPNTVQNTWWRTVLGARAVASLSELDLPFEPATVAMSASRQSGLEAAAGDDGMFIVWSETDESPATLRGRILRYDGRQSPVLTISESEDAAGTPAVAYGGGVWLVAWTEDVYRELPHKREKTGLRRMARRYDRSGNSLDVAPLFLNSEAYTRFATSVYHEQKITIASSGSEFFVAWPALGANNFRELRSARIAVDGTLLDPQLLYITSEGDPMRGEPHAVWTGSDYFLLWREVPPSALSSVPPLPSYARSTRVSTSGNVSGIFPPIITTAAAYDIMHSPFEAATNGKTVLVTWSERFENRRGCVFVQEFTFDGAPLIGKQEVTCGTGHRAIPSRAYGVWDGTRYQVIYSFDETMWAYPADNSGPPVELFRTSGLLQASRPIATPLGIVLTYTRSATEFGSLPRAFRRVVSFDPPRRRAVR